MEKKKVSRFEYAIAQAANVPNIDQLEPTTESEEFKMIEEKFEEQAAKFKIINPPAATLTAK